MSTFTGRPNTALLVIGVQNGVVEEAHDRDAVVKKVATLVDKARDGGVPVEYGAPTPDKVIAHTNLYWEHQAAPGRKAAVQDTADVGFGA